MATKPVEQNVSYNDTLNAKWTVNTGDDGAPITSVGPKHLSRLLVLSVALL